MALKPVQDPSVLAALNAPQPAAPAGPRAVTDPALLAQLNAPAQDSRTTIEKLAATVPGSPEAAALDSQLQVERAANPTPAKSFWDDLGDFRITPDMDLRSLSTFAMGAPEAAATIANNSLVQSFAGLTAPFVAPTDDDAANYIRDFTAENSYYPRGDSAREVVEGLGVALAPMENVKRKLGETTLGVTDSPLAATGADLLPDVALTIAGAGRGVPGRNIDLGEGFTRPTPAPMRDLRGLPADELGNELAGGPVEKVPADTPVTRSRRAGFQIRPSDAERIGVETPGKFREKLAPTDARRDFTLKNQENANKLAAEEIGVPEGARLDDAAFETAKQPHFDTYSHAESVAKRGPISAEFADLLTEGVKQAKFKAGSKPTTTETIGALRRRARKAVQSEDLAMQDHGEALLDLADKIEDAFGAHLEAVGAPETLAAYRDARTALAKINDVEQATRAGQVDPAIIYKRGEKGSKLSGRLKMIAEAHENFPDVTGSTMSSAGRVAVKEPSIAGMTKDAVTGALRKVPYLGEALDIRSQRFQDKLGREATPAELTYFDEYGAPQGATPPQALPDAPTVQQEMLGSAFEFAAPEGAVGRPPLKPMPTDQIESLGTMLDLERPPGSAPANPKRTITQQAEEFQPFMDLVPPPGKVGKPKGPKAKATAEPELTPEEIAYIQQFLKD